MIRVDVAIIGGGPAGCSTALALANRGLSAAIISGAAATNKPTETAVPALAHVLRSLNAEEALRACEPCYGICSHWGRMEPALRPSLVDPYGHAWFVHRERFDGHLQRCARESGTIWLDAIGLSVHFDDKNVSILTSGEEVRAQWLVAANGSPTWAARVTEQAIEKHDSLTALWARIPLSPNDRFLFVEPTDCGWWYLCPDDGPGAVACLVTDPESARQAGAAQLQNWNNLFRETRLFHQFCKAVSTENIHAAFTGLFCLPRTQGERWIVVGDAAVKLDPIGSAGTMTALDAGRRAAAAIADSLQSNSVGLQNYERWSSRLVAEFGRRRQRHYLLESVNRSTDFWERRSAKNYLEARAS